ncbi:MAG: uracil-DNA glycosylase [Gammaproteobacteria bacterium]|jgi:DNA polymerase|nr:uracil-DNA glycosylase [Gammaproteobacteria bacterium]
MHEARRLAYLDAMGIDVWRLRGTAAAEAPPPATASEAAPAYNTEPMPPARTTDAPVGPAVSSAAEAAEKTPPPPSAAPPQTPRADDEPPPWTDADLAGLPADAAEVIPPTDLPADTGGASWAEAVAAMDWPTLEQAVAGCRACGLCERRTQTVFGVGDRSAPVMFIGEGPGADEDRQGEPFVGRAGQLLNRMLAAASFKREQVYIANIVKCRPPNNRDPSADEAGACRAYLQRQIMLVAPKLIVCLGRVPASNLLSTTESVGRLRGRLHHYAPTGTPLLVTYHPSYYLRSPEQKAKGWEDLQRMLALLESEGAVSR